MRRRQPGRRRTTRARGEVPDWNLFRTIQKAADLPLPGDIVTVQDGVYTNNNVSWKPALDITRSGRANVWIKHRAYPGHSPKLQFNGWRGNHVAQGAAYIVITGFDVEGNIKNATLAYCLTKADVAEALCNGNGIEIHSDHTRVAENEVHHCGTAGMVIGRYAD